MRGQWRETQCPCRRASLTDGCFPPRTLLCVLNFARIDFASSKTLFPPCGTEEDKCSGLERELADTKAREVKARAGGLKMAPS
jgi:hypothetical protein